MQPVALTYWPVGIFISYRLPMILYFPVIQEIRITTERKHNTETGLEHLKSCTEGD
jgi:hypothetical protein